MKKITLLVLGIFALSLTSVGQNDATAFNDKLVSLQKELLTNVAAIRNDRTDSISSMARLKKIQAEIQRKIEEVVAVKGPADGEAFKDAMLDSFAQVDLMYDILIKLAEPHISPEAEAKLKAQLDAAKAESKTIDQNVRTEQNKFTATHNLKLQ